MPATGTPEPGGMFWDDVMPIIKNVCSVSNVVGADINELAPIKNFNSCNFLTAKLAYKIISYVFEFKKKYLRSLILHLFCTFAPFKELYFQKIITADCLSNKVLPKKVPNPNPALFFDIF